MYRPKTTTKRKTLKKVRKTWDLDPASRTKARKVENPPLKTAGPRYQLYKMFKLKLEKYLFLSKRA